MNIQQAIKMAETWTTDLKREGQDAFPIWEMVATLLNHVKQQEKDIKHLTDAVRASMVRNKELMNELRRSHKNSETVD